MIFLPYNLIVSSLYKHFILEIINIERFKMYNILNFKRLHLNNSNFALTFLKNLNINKSKNLISLKRKDFEILKKMKFIIKNRLFINQLLTLDLLFQIVESMRGPVNY